MMNDVINSIFYQIKTLDAKVNYDDIRYEREEWPAVKASELLFFFFYRWRNSIDFNILFEEFPTGQIPVLEWKGQMLPQVN